VRRRIKSSEVPTADRTNSCIPPRGTERLISAMEISGRTGSDRYLKRRGTPEELPCASAELMSARERRIGIRPSDGPDERTRRRRRWAETVGIGTVQSDRVEPDRGAAVHRSNAPGPEKWSTGTGVAFGCVVEPDAFGPAIRAKNSHWGHRRRWPVPQSLRQLSNFSLINSIVPDRQADRGERYLETETDAYSQRALDSGLFAARADHR